MPISDFTEATETILDQTVSRLGDYPSWTVSRFSGTALGDLLDELSAASLPAAIVVYRGAERSAHPRRRLQVSVIVAALGGSREQSAIDARTLLDKSFELLDEHAYNDATWEYRGDRAIDVGNGLAAYTVDFDVRLD